MKTILHRRRMGSEGVALVIVLGYVSIATIFATMFLHAVKTHIAITKRQVNMERAFYAAEGGAERAVAHIMNGGSAPTILEGTIGSGNYVVSIVSSSGASYGAGSHEVAGELRINPNNSSQNEFVLTLPDGSKITRDDLHNEHPGYAGPAVSVHVKPSGNGNQNTLIVDGEVVEVSNANTYDFIPTSMTVNLYNDHINSQGKAVGKWYIAIIADGTTIQSSGTDGDEVSFVRDYVIVSRGTAQGVTRVVSLEGLRAQTWAKYALWSNNNRSIYFKDHEVFWGAVHANSKLYFSTAAGSTNPPTFHGKVTSASTTVGPQNNSADACLFYDGIHLGVSAESMASVSFSQLLGESGLVLTGETTIVFSGTNTVISNSRRGWNSYTSSIPVGTLIYVETTQSGSDKYGDVSISGQLDGRITIAAERDINITDHLTYEEDPKTNSASDDALGLISGRNIVVKTSCPDDVQIYAHMLATGNMTSQTSDGSFGVQSYSSGSPRGQLTVHGGIAQDYRGAVGTFSTQTGNMTHGFEKNYTYDTRFSVNPPPYYPTIADSFAWDTWKEGEL